MFSKIWTKTSTPDFLAQIERLKTAIAEADAVVIGAGAGLSTAAGFTYSGERFERYFSDFAAKYGIRDMYSGGFYPFPTSEEFWAYWSRYIFINRYQDAPKPVYDTLLRLIRGKDYFVITTNVDHCFQKAGFDKKRLFYTQGDYGLFQCSEPCRPEAYDNEAVVREMVERQQIPTPHMPASISVRRTRPRICGSSPSASTGTSAKFCLTFWGHFIDGKRDICYYLVRCRRKERSPEQHPHHPALFPADTAPRISENGARGAGNDVS